MTMISLKKMRKYLSKSISSLNKNKLNGMLAEIDFRNYLSSIGFADRVSLGGWIFRNEGPGKFGKKAIVFFPETIVPGNDYSPGRPMPALQAGLHAISSVFHTIGIDSYFCKAIVNAFDDANSIEWLCVQLGLPTSKGFTKFPPSIPEFNPRSRRYNFLTHRTKVTSIPDNAVPDEFSKEHMRVSFRNQFMAETSDVDGVFWGQRIAYPIEIKEKTPAPDRRMGEYFGIDIGPFVKFAFYAAKRGNLHSLFVVREIDDVKKRNLVNWWYIQFDHLAQVASWVFKRGGTSMGGGSSAVVGIPKSEFKILDRSALSQL
ncbi:MAG: hypothetical protein ABIA67_01905 [Candidatus Margulisiibacteriota bacterium]